MKRAFGKFAKEALQSAPGMIRRLYSIHSDRRRRSAATPVVAPHSIFAVGSVNRAYSRHQQMEPTCAEARKPK